MIELFIDDQSVDISQSTAVSVTLGIGTIEDPDKSATAFTKTIKVPATSHNRAIMQYAEQIHGVKLFNNQKHAARVEVNGVTVMSGIAQLSNSTMDTDGSEWYNVSIVGDEYAWVSGAKEDELHKALDIEFAYTPGNVSASSTQTGNSLLRFLPVSRGAFKRKSTAKELYVDRTRIGGRDYFPFFNCWEALSAIFVKHEYKPVSSFKDDLKTLYFAGEFKETETDEIEKTHGFMAGRKDEEYRVYIAAGVTSVDIDVFQTAVPVDEDSDFFNNGAVVEPIGGRPLRFVPKEDIDVRFEIELVYESTLFNNATNTGLTYVRSAYFLGEVYEFDQAFEYDEYLTDIDNADFEQKIFFHTSMIGYTGLGVGYDEGNVSYMGALNAERGAVYPIPAGKYGKLWLQGADGWQSLEVTSEKWSKEHDTLVGGRGFQCYYTLTRVDMSVSLRTTPKRLYAGVSYDIGTVQFYIYKNTYNSACRLTIGYDCTIKPVFLSTPGFGAVLKAEDMAAEYKQMEIVSAVRQMFNLFFYTNPETKEVFIEPRQSFYQDVIVDWSDRVDYSKEIVIEEAGNAIGKAVKLGYASSDVVDKINKKSGSQYAGVTIPLENKCQTTEKAINNPLFTPAVIRDGECPGVKAVPMIVAAVSDEEQSLDEAEVNIPPTIARLQRIDYVDPKSGTGYFWYPVMAFQNKAEGVNLGFDDIKDGQTVVKGLSRYYQGNIDTYNGGRKITANIRLSPVDVEAIMLPNDLKRDFRALYRLRLWGEDVYCRLEEIKDYNPTEAGSTKCLFVTE